jgi:hypothetical protein
MLFFAVNGERMRGMDVRFSENVLNGISYFCQLQNVHRVISVTGTEIRVTEPFSSDTNPFEVEIATDK